MKAYGKPLRGTANRKKRGTSMACPCCIPKQKTKDWRKSERKRGKEQAKEID